MKEYQDPETLRRLYHDEGLSSLEMADRLGCSKKTVLNWMNRHEIDRDPPTTERPPCYTSDPEGYKLWRHDDVGGQKWVREHRLLAVSVFGFEKVREKIVHHKNNCPFDNRPDNIELMTQSEHARLHVEQNERNEKGQLNQK